MPISIIGPMKMKKLAKKRKKMRTNCSNSVLLRSRWPIPTSVCVAVCHQVRWVGSRSTSQSQMNVTMAPNQMATR